MATEIAKKKGKTPRAKPNPGEATAKKAVSSPQPAKRKAAEDVSPVATKKSKPVKATATMKKPKEKRAAAVPGAEPKNLKKPSKAADEEDAESDEAGEEQTQALVRTLGESDDDEEAAVSQSTFETGQDVGTVPKVSSQTRKSLEAAGAKDGPRVIYIGHIPYGFFEHEIRQYLSQFGPVSNLRVSRSKKTGGSKGYAFVEFEDADTAAIVAKTMDSYLLFGRVLRVRLVPKESQHESLFKGANKRFKKVPRAKMAGKALEKPKGVKEWDEKVGQEARRRSSRQAKLEAIGYEFEAPELKKAVSVVAAPEGVPAASPAVQVEDEPKAIEAPPAAAPVDDKAKAGGAEPERVNGDGSGEVAKAAPKVKSAAKAKKGSKGKKVKS